MALLISRKPLATDYRNPLSIGAMRLDALSSALTISKEVSLGGKTNTNYNSLAQQIPILPDDLLSDSNDPKCLVYNLSHTLKPQLQRCLAKFYIQGLPTMNKIAHFTSESPSCRLCGREKESQVHLLESCTKATAILWVIGRKAITLNLPSWESTSDVCGLTSKKDR